MKEFKKSLVILAALFLIASLVSPAFAITAGEPASGTGIQKITNLTGNIWSTIKVVAQVAAIAAIVFAGVRYMFASADQKADIKKQTIILIVGAILVFAAVPFAQFVSNLGSQILQ